MGFKKLFGLMDRTVEDTPLQSYSADICELAERVYNGYQLVSEMSHGDLIISATGNRFCARTNESRAFMVVRREFERLAERFRPYPKAVVEVYVYEKDSQRTGKPGAYHCFSSINELISKMGPRERWPSRIATMGIVVH